MNSASWWAQKLGNAEPAARPAPLPPMPTMRPAAAPAPLPAPPQPNVQVTGDNFMSAAGQWRGGEASRTETSRCPNCGGDHYFSRANSGARVAPRCYDCGYTDGRPMQGITR